MSVESVEEFNTVSSVFNSEPRCLIPLLYWLRNVKAIYDLVDSVQCILYCKVHFDDMNSSFLHGQFILDVSGSW